MAKIEGRESEPETYSQNHMMTYILHNCSRVLVASLIPMQTLHHLPHTFEHTSSSLMGMLMMLGGGAACTKCVGVIKSFWSDLYPYTCIMKKDM